MSRLSVAARVASVVGLSAVALMVAEAPLSRWDRAQAEPQKAAGPVEIGGHYSISFNGFNIGDVRTESRVSGKSYVASSEVEISALLGAFQWKGVTRAAGTLSGASIEPSGYNFEYASSARAGSVRMGFEKGRVTQLAAVPQVPDPDDMVPLAPEHLNGVIDPLSALVALSRPSASGPCGRKLALFDGKQRFDVALLVRRKEMLTSRETGETVEGVVCRVKYTPVAGYRANADTAALAENSAIEVTFRPVPAASLWVPYRVSLPTIAGQVTLEAARIDISASSGAQIALVD